jgi:hypothetical protein
VADGKEEIDEGFVRYTPPEPEALPVSGEASPDHRTSKYVMGMHLKDIHAIKAVTGGVLGDATIDELSQQEKEVYRSSKLTTEGRQSEDAREGGRTQEPFLENAASPSFRQFLEEPSHIRVDRGRSGLSAIEGLQKQSVSEMSASSPQDSSRARQKGSSEKSDLSTVEVQPAADLSLIRRALSTARVGPLYGDKRPKKSKHVTELSPSPSLERARAAVEQLDEERVQQVNASPVQIAQMQKEMADLRRQLQVQEEIAGLYRKLELARRNKETSRGSQVVETGANSGTVPKQAKPSPVLPPLELATEKKGITEGGKATNTAPNSGVECGRTNLEISNEEPRAQIEYISPQAQAEPIQNSQRVASINAKKFTELARKFSNVPLADIAYHRKAREVQTQGRTRKAESVKFPHSSVRTIMTMSGEQTPNFPTSPLMDPARLEAKTRHTTRKADPTKGAEGSLQARLAKNPYALALATPIRECRLTGALLPNYFLQGFHLMGHPDKTKKLLPNWWVPTDMARSSKATKAIAVKESMRNLASNHKTFENRFEISHSVLKVDTDFNEVTHVDFIGAGPATATSKKIGVNAYILSSKLLLEDMNDRSTRPLRKAPPHLDLITQRTKRHRNAFKVASEAGWRQDMPDFMLKLWRRNLKDNLMYLVSEGHRGYLIHCEDWHEAMKKKSTSAFLWVGGSGEATNPPPHEWATLDVSYGEPGLKQTRKVPVFNLRALLGEDTLDELQANSKPGTWDTGILAVKSRRNTALLLQRFWKLQGYLAELGWTGATEKREGMGEDAQHGENREDLDVRFDRDTQNKRR